MVPRTLLFLALSMVAAPAAWPCERIALTATPWPSATNYDASGVPVSRFIPPELYSGASWDGSRELVIRPMHVTRKPVSPPDHPPILIDGPMPWPGDSSVTVLRRYRESNRRGETEQYFRINERGDGLGRVSDIRTTHTRAQMDECFKFPLGEWRQGEERRYRDSVIKILEIDFVDHCVPHALKFRWNDEGTYVFAPDRGMVSVTH
ncbi:MAG: hypothetical protein ACYC1L_16180 [Alphaproteobacteria bacterium]